MVRRTEGTTTGINLRVTPEEEQMARQIAERHGMSRNSGVRWAIRFAVEHAISTTDHTHCAGTSPCAEATQGLTP